MRTLLNVFLILSLSLPLLAQENLFSDKLQWKDYGELDWNLQSLMYLDVDERNTLFIKKKTYEDLKAKKEEKGKYILPVLQVEKGEPKHINEHGLNFYTYPREATLGRFDLYFFNKGEIISAIEYTFTSKDYPEKKPVVINLMPKEGEYINFLGISQLANKINKLNNPPGGMAPEKRSIFSKKKTGEILVTILGFDKTKLKEAQEKNTELETETYTMTLSREDAKEISGLARLYRDLTGKFFSRYTTEPYQEKTQNQNRSSKPLIYEIDKRI